MKVLSLFDGMGGAYLALQALGVTPERYYASEIDKYATKVSDANFGNKITQLGDVETIDGSTLGEIDLLIGGSPCTNLAICGDRTGLAGCQSRLFWRYVELLNEVKPKHFLLENVASMKKSDRDIITKELGVEPVEINSALLTAQNRKRLYWFNWEAPTIIDAKVKFSDILVDQKEAARLLHSREAILYMFRLGKDGRNHWDYGYHAIVGEEKTPCLVANLYKGVPYNVVVDLRLTQSNTDNDYIFTRKYHPTECERLQGVPDNYTASVSATQRYKMLGNGFTIPVISAILKEIV